MAVGMYLFPPRMNWVPPPLLEGGLADRTGHTLPLTTVQGTGAKMVLLSTLCHHGNKLLGTSVKDYLDWAK